MTQDTLDAFGRLSDILDTLRKQCPWDRVQTMDSLRYLTIEETYELSEAILNLSPAEQSDSMLSDCREILKLLTSIVKTTFINK